jgi:hypothetical protein
MKGYITILVVAIAALSACAQREVYTEDLSIHRHVVEPFQPALPSENDSSVAVLDTLSGRPVTEKVLSQMDSLALIYGAVEEIKGFRIQIYSGQDRRKAQDIRNRAIKLFEQELKRKEHPPVDLIYDEPYFRVKIGNFLNKLDAQPDLLIFEDHEDFGDALLVPDRVDIHNLD